MFKKIRDWLASCKDTRNEDIDNKTPSSHVEQEDSILTCARYIINNGKLVTDNSSYRFIPDVTLGDDKGNTLFISWYASSSTVKYVFINNLPVPDNYDNKIFSMIEDRIKVLRKEHLEKVINSVK